MASPLPHPLAQSDFHVLAQVGEGTYGRVFKAIHKATNTTVALKIVNNVEEEDGLSFTAIREIKYLQLLNQNPNIVKLLGNCFWEDGSLVLVFEYMENDLSGILSLPGVQLQSAQIKCFMKQLLEGLHACHSAAIMHRDIKAANLLIHAGTLKLADFGLATSTTRNIYSTNVVTLWYRAPELLLGETKYQGQVDIWSAGCIFIELLTHTSPFPGRDEKHQMELIFKNCGTPNEQNWPGISKTEGWRQYIRQMQPSRNKLRELFANEYPSVDIKAVDLIEKMLTLDPSKRISATEALDHDYFWTDPMPCKPSDLPTFQSLHEYEAKENRRSAAAKRQRGESYVPNVAKAHFTGHPAPHHNHTQPLGNGSVSHNTYRPTATIPPSMPPSHRAGLVGETRRREDVLPLQANTRRVVGSGGVNIDRRGGFVQNEREERAGVYNGNGTDGRRVESIHNNNSGWRSSSSSNGIHPSKLASAPQLSREPKRDPQYTKLLNVGIVEGLDHRPPSDHNSEDQPQTQPPPDFAMGKENDALMVGKRKRGGIN